jgi:hypothetical protein
MDKTAPKRKLTKEPATQKKRLERIKIDHGFHDILQRLQ